MEITLSGTDSVSTELAQIYKRHVKTVYRVCFTYMKNAADTEDAVSDTFVKMLRAFNSRRRFDSAEHEKAWLIRAAINVCKDNLKSRRHSNVSLELLEESVPAPECENHDDVLQAVLALPEKYKTVVYLYYYEGYNSAEIAAFLKKPKSTVRNHLHEAREVLRKELAEEELP